MLIVEVLRLDFLLHPSTVDRCVGDQFAEIRTLIDVQMYEACFQVCQNPE